MLRTCCARAGSSFGNNAGRLGSIFIAGKRGIVHVQYDPLGIFHETNAVLGNVGSSNRGDARISKNHAAAAVRSLDAPEKRALVLPARRFICERSGARRNPDEMAT